MTRRSERITTEFIEEKLADEILRLRAELSAAKARIAYLETAHVVTGETSTGTLVSEIRYDESRAVMP